MIINAPMNFKMFFFIVEKKREGLESKKREKREFLTF